MQAMEAERTKVNVARERAVVVHQEAQTEHKRAVMMVRRFSCHAEHTKPRPATACSGRLYCAMSAASGGCKLWLCWLAYNNALKHPGL